MIKIVYIKIKLKALTLKVYLIYTGNCQSILLFEDIVWWSGVPVV